MSDSDLQRKFAAAAQAVQSMPRRPDNATLLQIYALYKQATSGDISGKRPGMTDFAGRAKYDAWSALKGTSQESAMQAYVDLAQRLADAG